MRGVRRAAEYCALPRMFTRRPNPFSGVGIARVGAQPLAVQAKHFVTRLDAIIVEPVITIVTDDRLAWLLFIICGEYATVHLTNEPAICRIKKVTCCEICFLSASLCHGKLRRTAVRTSE